MSRLPSPVLQVVSDILAQHYYSHRSLNTLFAEAGAPGEPPIGTCQQKCYRWLQRADEDQSVDAFAVLGGVLLRFMDQELPEGLQREAQKRIDAILRRNGLSYLPGGKIVKAGVGSPSRSLDAIIRDRDLLALQTEFDRAVSSVESDPPSALTAACAILESLCKVYIADEGLPMPEKQTIKPLWAVVQKSLGLDPKAIEDEDSARVLGGLASVVDGLGSWRTHTGSAHGRGRKAYKVQPRHARLAVHAAHTLVTFLVETWDDRKAKSMK